MNDRPNRRVACIVYDQLCTFEFGVATELFALGRPELGVDWYDFAAVSVDGGSLSGPGGISLSASTDLKLIENAGTIIIPGWKGPDEAPPEALTRSLHVAHSRGARVMSICSGVFVLAATGLLDGHSATTHWRYAEQLTDSYPQITVQPDVLYVDNGSTLTSAGSAAGLDLGLHLIRRDYGAEIANRVAKRLVMAPQRSGGQAQFIDHSLMSADYENSVGSTVAWAIENLAEPLRVKDLASRAAMSPRTFARRFRAEMGVPPHQWVVTQRVAAAQRLLETTDTPIDVVATECGFGSSATLRHHFSRESKTSPTAYRSSFNPAAS